MKKVNVPLTAGLLIFLIVFLAAMLPGMVSEQGPYVMQSLRSWVENGRVNFQRAPFPPSESNTLGTDELGRDIWSRIVWGTRLTLTLGILVVLGRFFIALPVALAAGFGNPVARSSLRLAGLVFSAIPALLFAIIILQQQFFVSLEKTGSIAAFVIVLSGVGWAKLGLVLSEKTEDILRRPFILSERAIGKRPLNIALENVLPHLAPEAMVLFFMELARALSMVMQLGIFSVFIGNIRVVQSTDEGIVRYMDISFEPEWAGMLGTARSRLSSSPWMVIWPTLAFLVCVFAFNLVGEGLQRHFRNRHASADRNRGRRKAVIWAGTALVLLALIAPAVVKQVAEPEPLGLREERLSGGKIPGTDGKDPLADGIGERMEAWGLVPLEGEDFRITYPIGGSRYLISSTMSVQDAAGHIPAVEGRDYSILTADGEIEGVPIADTRDSDWFDPAGVPGIAGRLALIDGSLYSADGLEWILESGLKRSHAAGAMIVTPEIGGRPLNRMMAGSNSRILLEVSADFAAKVEDRADATLNLTAETVSTGGGGQNLAGMLPGRDPVMGEELVVVAFSREDADQGSALVDRLAAGGDNRRSYVFMFLDHTASDEFHGIRAFEKSLPFEAADAVLYLDMTSLHAAESGTLTVNMEQAPITRYYAWSVGHMLEDQLEGSGFTLRSETMVNRNGAFKYRDLESADIMFWKHGVPSIRIAGGEALEIMGFVARVLERNDI